VGTGAVDDAGAREGAEAGDREHGPTPSKPGRSLLVRVELATLLDRSALPATLLTTLTGGRMWVDAPTARRLADEREVDLRLVVVDDTGAVVGVGRKQRYAPGWLRDATLALHDTCSAPGCRVAARVCQVDHARPWTPRTDRGPGRTDIDQLAPLCGTDQHRGAGEAVVGEVVRARVGRGIERVGHGRRPQPDPGGEGEERLPVRARVGGHRPQLALLEQVPRSRAGDPRDVDPGERQHPPRSRASSASGTTSPAGANEIAASSGSGGRSPGAPTHPPRARRASSRPASLRVTTCSSAPIASATCAVRCAEPPKPQMPSRSPGRNPERSSAR
jgi:hypothetical protein